MPRAEAVNRPNENAKDGAGRAAGLRPDLLPTVPIRPALLHREGDTLTLPGAGPELHEVEAGGGEYLRGRLRAQLGQRRRHDFPDLSHRLRGRPQRGGEVSAPEAMADLKSKLEDPPLHAVYTVRLHTGDLPVGGG